MNKKPLPVVLSCPHGGLSVPVEIQDLIIINNRALYNDCDLYIDRLFDFHCVHLGSHVPEDHDLGVLASVTMPIARALIDVNRPLKMLGNPDGPIKTQTSYGQPIYRTPLSEVMQSLLVERYWQTYHRQVEEALLTHRGELKLVIDCHNMAQHGPTAYRDAGQRRPLICVATLADQAGNPRPEYGWSFCDRDAAFAALRLAEELFSDMDLLHPNPEGPAPVALLNQPFSGSYVLMHHLNPKKQRENFMEKGIKVPAHIMIEVNRGLFVGDQSAATAIGEPNEERIRAVRQRLYQWTLGLLDIFR